MTEKSKRIWVYLISSLFIGMNTYLIVNHVMWGALAPLLLIILLLYFVSVDKIILLITFFTPLAINISDMDLGFGISLPTEPLMLGVLIFFFIKILYENKYDIRIIKHPVSIAILFNLLWILITSITSEMPLVSFKFLLARLWFVIPFFFFIIVMFKSTKTIKSFYWLYTIGLLIVVFYTIYNHSLRGFDEESGHWVMTPFYNDHTAYGAILSMFIPVMLGLSMIKSYATSTRIITFSILLIFILAIILSYSRAAWLSLLVAFGVFILIKFRIKFIWVFSTLILLVGLFIVFQQQIFDTLEKNKQDSSANFVEHVQSISNISSDASNLERINRWQSALRMFSERPFWGWGPGTYQFMYAPFQRSKEKTIISTNAGDKGNAHSEYIGPMAESGFLGMLTMLFIIGFVIYTGIRINSKRIPPEIKILNLSALIGLVAYFAHGFLNNFLDSDKASVPVWGFMAIIVAIDIYHTKEIGTSDTVVEASNLPE